MITICNWGVPVALCVHSMCPSKYSIFFHEQSFVLHYNLLTTLTNHLSNMAYLACLLACI